ncbi:hypothetical protein [Streptomyces jumonjinensis]|uniref:hypothetical protein n=1 Tax=Streptomyces jumonjinensis TaxID=1945 RepID=UPI0037B81048
MLTSARHTIAEGRAVAFINLQIGHDQLLGNVLAAESSTSGDRAETFNEGRLARVRRAGTYLSGSRLRTWTPVGNLRPERITEALDGIEDDLALIVVYSLPADNDQGEGATLKALQDTAALRNAAVLVTARLARASDGDDRTPHRPDRSPGPPPRRPRLARRPGLDATVYQQIVLHLTGAAQAVADDLHQLAGRLPAGNSLRTVVEAVLHDTRHLLTLPAQGESSPGRQRRPIRFGAVDHE